MNVTQCFNEKIYWINLVYWNKIECINAPAQVVYKYISRKFSAQKSVLQLIQFENDVVVMQSRIILQCNKKLSFLAEIMEENSAKYTCNKDKCALFNCKSIMKILEIILHEFNTIEARTRHALLLIALETVRRTK